MSGTIRTVFPALGTVNTITICDPAQKRAAEDARALVQGLDRSLSVFRPESELSRFNALCGGAWMDVGAGRLRRDQRRL